MKKEFMLYVRNSGDAKISLTAEDHLAFIKQCENYIGRLKKEGKLIAAQPIIREGCIISKDKDKWVVSKVDPSREVQVGYYHIIAESIDEAIDIAKNNPEFEYVSSATIEVRPIKLKEEKTDFVYPK